MDFSWSDEQEDSYRRVIREASEKIGKCAAARGFRRYFNRSEWELCGKIGLLGLLVPREFGGLGFGCVGTARGMEAFGNACEDMGLVFAVGAHLFACALPILEWGTEEIRKAMLPRLCSGEWVGANAITEADAGSDVFAMRTRAIRDGEDYVLTGLKSFVTNAPLADVFIVYATCNPEHGFLGLAAFAVERDTPGLSVGEPFEKMGLESIPTSSIRLENCRVPGTRRLGPEGQGGLIFRRSMQWERTCLLAGYLGMMERQLTQVVAHARNRKQFGHSIGKYQAVSHRIADMKLRLEASRLLLYRACWLLDRGTETATDACLAKLAVSEAAVRSSLDAIQVFGGTGFQSESGIERALRDSVGATIASGTSEMMREIVAKELGL